MPTKEQDLFIKRKHLIAERYVILNYYLKCYYVSIIIAKKKN